MKTYSAKLDAARAAALDAALDGRTFGEWVRAGLNRPGGGLEELRAEVAELRSGLTGQGGHNPGPDEAPDILARGELGRLGGEVHRLAVAVGGLVNALFVPLSVEDNAAELRAGMTHVCRLPLRGGGLLSGPTPLYVDLGDDYDDELDDDELDGDGL